MTWHKASAAKKAATAAKAEAKAEAKAIARATTPRAHKLAAPKAALTSVRSARHKRMRRVKIRL